MPVVPLRRARKAASPQEPPDIAPDALAAEIEARRLALFALWAETKERHAEYDRQVAELAALERAASPTVRRRSRPVGTCSWCGGDIYLGDPCITFTALPRPGCQLHLGDCASLHAAWWQARVREYERRGTLPLEGEDECP